GTPAEAETETLAAPASARVARATPGGAQARPAAPTAPPAPQNRLAVLIVEDDGFQQKLIGRLMTGLDIDVLFADSGAQALEQMWEHKPDLVLMDVGLP